MWIKTGTTLFISINQNNGHSDEYRFKANIIIDFECYDLDIRRRVLDLFLLATV